MWIHLLSLGLISGAGGQQEKPTGGGYDDDKPKRKKRYVVERDGNLLVFSSKQDAIAALDSYQAKTAPAERQDAAKAGEATGVASQQDSIALDQIRALAAERLALEVFQKRLAQMQYEALLRQYEVWLDERDIEDILGMI